MQYFYFTVNIYLLFFFFKLRNKTECVCFYLLLQVHLGVLYKNEQYEEDMIDLLEWIHPYVPGHSEDCDANKKPIKVLTGGDYLTFERTQGAQSAMQDARTPSARLEGLIPKTEDFHTQAEWLKVSQTYDIYLCTGLSIIVSHWKVASQNVSLFGKILFFSDIYFNLLCNHERPRFFVEC